MVVRIISGKNIQGLLYYNEHKVSNGKAALILGNGFAKEVDKMTFKQKHERFEHLISLRPRVKTNAMHISLNFDPAEKPDDYLMQHIAISYMKKIGFDEQPYLVYRHTDAAHAHVHIVTALIRPNGQRMDIHNIGKLRSEPARKAIEREFDLIPASRKRASIRLPIVAPVRSKYGQIATKKGISRVVRAVMDTYQYSSLAELNAILRTFNVQADRGQPGSIMHEKGGLLYTILDANGSPIGVPIKASAISGKPTLKVLEKQFEKHEQSRKPAKKTSSGGSILAFKKLEREDHFLGCRSKLETLAIKWLRNIQHQIQLHKIPIIVSFTFKST